MFFEFHSNADDVRSADADGFGDLEDFVVFDASNGVIRRGNDIQTTQESNPFWHFRHLAKGTRDKMIVSCVMGRGRMNRSVCQQLGPIVVDFGEVFQMTRDGLAFDVVRSQVGPRNSGQQVGKSRYEASLFRGKRIESGPDLDQTFGFVSPALRGVPDSKKAK